MDLLFHLPHKVRGRWGLWEGRLAWAGHWHPHRTLRGHMQNTVIFSFVLVSDAANCDRINCRSGWFLRILDSERWPPQIIHPKLLQTAPEHGRLVLDHLRIP